MYTFTSYVFENLMNRYGFEKIYRLVYSMLFTQEKKNLINHYNNCLNDLLAAEKLKISNFKI